MASTSLNLRNSMSVESPDLKEMRVDESRYFLEMGAIYPVAGIWQNLDSQFREMVAQPKNICWYECMIVCRPDNLDWSADG